jgi:hypothetical protein
MRIPIAPMVLTSALFLTMGLIGSLAHGSDTLSRKNVKTGILPSGGFYRIYEVACNDDSSASVASIDGNRRWCVLNEEELNCFARAREASNMACTAWDEARGQGQLDVVSAGQ